MQFGANTLLLFLITGVLAPIGSYLSYRRINSGKPLPPKIRRFRTTILLQLVLLIVAINAADENGLDTWIPPGDPTLWFYGMLIAVFPALALPHRWNKLPEARKKRLLIFMPENRGHLAYWIPISLLAGLGEEIAYRGDLFSILREQTHSLWWALLVAVLLFAVGHMAQGFRAVFGIAYLALVYHVFVLLSGSLLIAMCMHASHNLLIGMAFIRLARRDHLLESSEPPIGAQPLPDSSRERVD